MKLVAGIIAQKIAVDFTNLVVNDYYEMASGKIVTQYDAAWKGITDVDEIIEDAIFIYGKASEALTDIFAAFTGTCTEIKMIEEQIALLEKGLALDPTQDANNTEVKDAIIDLKNAVISLKTCANCVTSNLKDNSNAKIANVLNPCNGIFKDCEDKKKVFDAKTLLNQAFKQDYYCKMLKTASEKKCNTENGINCYYYGEVRMFLTSPAATPKEKFEICRSILKDGQWIVWRGPNSNLIPYTYDEDDVSFNKAVIYNIQNNNYELYPSIRARNAWYRWADKKVRIPKNNYWFAAAKDVTSWRAVGAADNLFNFGYVYNEEEFLMRAVNKRLLQQNFKNFGKFVLGTGPILTAINTPIYLTGVPLELKMVEIEQDEVENYIAQAKVEFIQKYGTQKVYCRAGTNQWLSPYDCAIKGINVTSDGSGFGTVISDAVVWLFYGGGASDPFQKAMYDFNHKVPFDGYIPTLPYNFLTKNHRIYIGKRMAHYLRGN